MFSVIIPLYNKAPYIQKALDSVFEQSFQNFEVIIVNDGSTDKSLDVLRNYVDKLRQVNIELFSKITVIDQKNQGVSTTRNNAVKIAKNEYLAFLDADDWWEPDFLLEMRNLVEHFPLAGLWASSYYVVKNYSKRLVRIGLAPNFDKGLINYFEVYANTLEMPVWTGAVIMKKSVYLEEKGFKPNIAMGEDFELWVRVALRYPVAFLNKPLSNYNFDVDVKNKAVDNYVVYPPEKHFIFHLDYLVEYESKIQDLKELLDKLRMYCLFPYRFKNCYSHDYKKEINKVNFNNFSLKNRLSFILPVFLVRWWINIKLYISQNMLNPLRLYSNKLKKNK